MRLVCSIIVAVCVFTVHSTNNRYARARQRERRWSMNDCSTIMLMMMTMTKPTLHTHLTSRHIGKMAQKTSSYTQYHNHTHKHFQIVIFEVAAKNIYYLNENTIRNKMETFHVYCTVAHITLWTNQRHFSHHRYLNDSTSCFTSIIVFAVVVVVVMADCFFLNWVETALMTLTRKNIRR